MRIISGKYKGRKLPVSSKLDLRPTTDFAKESLFNLLDNKIDLDGISFIDLFSGTGNIGFELISRGAAKGLSVDISSTSYAYRSQIMKMLEVEGLQNIKADVFQFLKRQKGSYDLVFADPPYDLALLVQIPDLIYSQDLLKPDGLFVLEHPEEHTFGKHPMFLDHRRYGRVNFTFFKSQS